MVVENLWTVVHLGVSSPLKTDLNKAVMTLSAASEPHFRPHVCLNGEEGVRVLEQITPHSNTEVTIRSHLIVSVDDAWLNVKFNVYLNNMCWPTNFAELSPRQTAFVIQHLSAETRAIVLEKVRRWYLERFLVNIQKGLAKITEQFANGDPMLASDHQNRILDIPGERGVDVQYTEPEIVGKQLYWALVFGGTTFDHEEGGLFRADRFIVNKHKKRKDAVDGIFLA